MSPPLIVLYFLAMLKRSTAVAEEKIIDKARTLVTLSPNSCITKCNSSIYKGGLGSVLTLNRTISIGDFWA